MRFGSLIAAVIASFGVANWTTAGSGANRGAKIIRGVLYVVQGSRLLSVDRNGLTTDLGEVPGSAHVFIEGDENNVMVVDPVTQAGYYWNGTITQLITDDDWPGAVWLGYLDGYFIIIAPDTGQFYITANRNPASVNSLDFASAERYPDNLVTGIVDHGELVLFGTESGGVFYDSGDSDFPITKAPSGDFEVGCKAKYGPAKLGNTVYFSGSDGKVYKLNGYAFQVISTPVVEQAIERATDKDFRGLTWNEPGHAFYALTSTDFNFVYDISTDLWHERESHGHTAWRWSSVVRAYDKWIVGDTQSNALGVLSADTFAEFGEVLSTECTSPSVSNDNELIKHSRVELVFEQGVGIATGQGEDPQVMLQFSDDGGRTWSNEKWRSLGRQGEFKRRALWWRCGVSRDRVYRYRITDPVRRTLILATSKAGLARG